MDYKIFRAINQLAGNSRLLDTIMVIISKKARYAFLLLLIYMWFQNHFHKKVTLLAGISSGITYIITFFMKLFFFKPRPFLKHGVHLLPPFPSPKNSSFPSKHTTLAFSLAASVLFYQRSIGLIMSLLAVLSGFSRIWMGHHYPSDIIKSAVLGSSVAIVVNKAKSKFNPFVNRIINSSNRFLPFEKFKKEL